MAAGNKEEAMHVLQKAAKMNNSTLPKGTLVDTKVVGLNCLDPDLMERYPLRLNFSLRVFSISEMIFHKYKKNFICHTVALS